MPENARQGSRHDHERSDQPQYVQRHDGSSKPKKISDNKDETRRGYAEEGLFHKLIETDETAANQVTRAVGRLLHVLCEDLLEQVKKMNNNVPPSHVFRPL
jgi:hypothetical protein